MKKLTYKGSGVDIKKADALIKKAKALIATTRVSGSVDAIGGFGGTFDPGSRKIKNPLLVASTDGVGTKLKIAQIAGKHDTIGIDLVAMCVNDILCAGAEPLFFLDYFSCGHLNKKTWNAVVKGIVRGCRMAGCALLGGETAEMPGMYKRGEYDLAGFSVGAADKKHLIEKKRIESGDVLLGIASTGLHSNGYSLVRKMFSRQKIKEHQRLLLKPTAIYVKPFLEIMKKVTIKGAAHITGGGFYNNVPRMLPANKKAVIKKGSWKIPAIFRIIKNEKNISEKELYRTFNMGVGMVVIINPEDAEKAKKMLKTKFKINSWIIGEIKTGRRLVEIV